MKAGKQRYDKLKVLGKGAFGKAYLVQDKSDGVKYVMKVMLLAGRSQRYRDECKQEAQMLSSLHHPNIVAYKESWSDEDNFYLVMEWANQGDLAHQIEDRQRGKAKRFDTDQVYRILVELCLAIEHCHDKRLLHRDLKPENVFLSATADGFFIVKLGDFGISKVMADDAAMAQTFCGTLNYMSPEIMRGLNYSNKTDIWSLGCILYNIITLKDAFPWQQGEARCKRLIMDGRYDPVPSSVDPGLRSLLSGMLEVNPPTRLSIKQCLAHPAIRPRLEALLHAGGKPPALHPQPAPAPSPAPSAGPASPPAAAGPAPVSMAGLQVAFAKGGKGSVVQPSLPPTQGTSAGPSFEFSKGRRLEVTANPQWRLKEDEVFGQQLKKLLGGGLGTYREGEVDLGFDGRSEDGETDEDRRAREGLTDDGVDAFIARMQDKARAMGLVMLGGLGGGRTRIDSGVAAAVRAQFKK